MEEFNNIEAEQTLLGMILVNNNHYWKAAYLTPNDFFEPVHQRIFEAIKTIIEAGEAVAPIKLKPKFENDAALKPLGGAKYLMQLAKTSMQMEDANELAKCILLEAQRRRVLLTYQQAVDALSDNSKDPSEQVARICMELEAAIDNTATQEAASDTMIIDQLAQKCTERLNYYSTGLPNLDEAMGGGLVAGKAYGFAAPKKSGKTALLATIAENLNQAGIKTLYVALEMGKEQIMERIAARRLHRNPVAFLTHDRKEQKFIDKLIESKKTGGNLYFLDYAGVSFTALKANLLRAVRRGKYQVVIIDYWQLIGGKSGKESEREHLDTVAQWIAEFSKAYNVATVTASQVNQEGNTRGGEGMRLAFDQVYKIESAKYAAPQGTEVRSYFEMMDTRYTQWANVGSKESPMFRINELGVYFEQIG
jgi:replicative DNA helicase